MGVQWVGAAEGGAGLRASFLVLPPQARSKARPVLGGVRASFQAGVWNLGGGAGSQPRARLGMKQTHFVTLWPMTLGKSFNFPWSHFHHRRMRW